MFDINEFENKLRAQLSDKWLRAVDIMNSGADEKSDKVVKHTRIEDLLYWEKRKEAEEKHNDNILSDIEKQGKEKLLSFPSLSQDVFNCFYNLSPELKVDEELTLQASKFNKEIIKKTLSDEEYLVLKQITEGKDFEAYEATKEFVQNIYNNLDELLKGISGEKKTLDVMEKIEQKTVKLLQELKEMAQQYQDLTGKGLKEEAELIGGKMISAKKDLERKLEQLAALAQIQDRARRDNESMIAMVISKSLEKSVEKVEEIRNILNAWGNASPENMTMETKKEIVDRVKKNRRFELMAKLVGRYREIAAQEMKNDYTYGRGERYDIELGNDLSRLITSEYAYLSMPETMPLFIKKYQAKGLKQYRRRDRVKKGCGNMIVCADESDSTKGGKDFWCKALSIALLDITIRNNKNFAYVHFSTDVLINEINRTNYNSKSVMDMASVFLGGGTNFEKALTEAKKLLDKEEYRYADLVFITDGECDLDDRFIKEFLESKKKMKFKVTGILLDKGNGSVSDISLKKFCDRIYRTSEMADDEITKKIIKDAI